MKRRKTSGIGILVAAQDRQAVPHRSELGCLGGEDLLGKLARQGIVGVNQDQAGDLYRPSWCGIIKARRSTPASPEYLGVCMSSIILVIPAFISRPKGCASDDGATARAGGTA
jgi:hypothetical protein